jgi:hypothetical protein
MRELAGVCRNCGQSSRSHDDGVCDLYSGGMLKSDIPAAPLSTLPERPGEPKTLTADERATVRLYLDGKFVQLPNGLRTMRDQLARYEALVSSLERELEVVRSEREAADG